MDAYHLNKKIVVSVFILPPSIKTLHERLLNRNKDDDKTVKLRMNESSF